MTILFLKNCFSAKTHSDCSTVFSAALKKTWSILFRPLTPTVSRPIDAGWYSFTFISAAYEPDMIYAVPLTSLSPSSSLSSLTPFFHSFPSSPLPLYPPAHLLIFALLSCSFFSHPLPSSPLSVSLYRALCPTGIRVAQQTTSATARRGKLMRRSSWPTMWVCTFITLLNV